MLEKTGDAEYRGQGGGGRGRLDRGALADSRLDAPLPWDHIDTGITKFWLKTDLQRALEAATVPDCSHSGLCSECGVCGDEFGENVVFEPPPVPAFQGHYRPNSKKAQRLRFRFAKGQDMVFVGHLDLMMTLDRAARRAALPVTADESPFAVRQRIYAPLPLPLGATASEDILEIFLTEKIDPRAVRARLQAQLPPGLDLVSVEEAEVYKLDGSNGEKVSAVLKSIEWYVGVVPAAAVTSEVDEDDDEVVALRREEEEEEEQTMVITEVDGEALQRGASALLSSTSLIIQRTSKKKKKTKSKMVDMRPALLEVEVVDGRHRIAAALPLPPGAAVLRFRSGVDNGGNPALSPAVLVELLGRETGQQLAVAHLHRSNIELNAATVPEPDWVRLRSLLREDGHLAVQRNNTGQGLWAAASP